MSIFRRKKLESSNTTSTPDNDVNATIENNSVYVNLEKIHLTEPKILRSKYEPDRLIIIGLDRLPSVVDCYLASDKQKSSSIGAIRYVKDPNDNLK